jgi:fumarylacetoacetase
MMAPELNATHDPALRSHVSSANRADTDFPIQNLPYGVFRSSPGDAFRVGVAIGDEILDVSASAAVLGPTCADAVAACRLDHLNGLMALDPEHWSRLRHALSHALSAAAPAEVQQVVRARLLPIATCELKRPVNVGDFTDFYASVHHATNAGKLIRPDNPLLPNYKYIPVGYHSRASTIRADGAEVPRPRGQIKPADADTPEYRSSARLDYEAELGFYIGRGSTMGVPIAIGDAGGHLFGVSLLNDWSARDIQVWEYQPLGPFLAKSFATIVSPWVVTTEALLPYRRPAYVRPAGDPAPLPHLYDEGDQQHGGFAVTVEAYLSSRAMRAQGMGPQLLGSGSATDLYWTVAQMIAHHTSNGCNLVAGDLIGSGTISGPAPENWGSLLEITWGGSKPLSLPTGESRTFVEDGDQIVLRGACVMPDRPSLGFGACRTTIVPAV